MRCTGLGKKWRGRLGAETYSGGLGQYFERDDERGAGDAVTKSKAGHSTDEAFRRHIHLGLSDQGDRVKRVSPILAYLPAWGFPRMRKLWDFTRGSNPRGGHFSKPVTLKVTDFLFSENVESRVGQGSSQARVDVFWSGVKALSLVDRRAAVHRCHQRYDRLELNTGKDSASAHGRSSNHAGVAMW